jgi:hypothetical protein
MEILHIIAWFLLVAFSFAAFAIFAQQGKAYAGNTYFYKHKASLGSICVLIVIAAAVFLKFF